MNCRLLFTDFICRVKKSNAMKTGDMRPGAGSFLMHCMTLMLIFGAVVQRMMRTNPYRLHASLKSVGCAKCAAMKRCVFLDPRESGCRIWPWRACNFYASRKKYTHKNFTHFHSAGTLTRVDRSARNLHGSGLNGRIEKCFPLSHFSHENMPDAETPVLDATVMETATDPATSPGKL